MKGDTDDEQTGINIVRRALEEPLRQIAQNAGLEGSVIININRVREDDKVLLYQFVVGGVSSDPKPHNTFGFI